LEEVGSQGGEFLSIERIDENIKEEVAIYSEGFERLGFAFRRRATFRKLITIKTSSFFNNLVFFRELAKG